MNRDFWKSAGYHLVSTDERGWLKVSEDYLRAYFTRPEIHPVEDSCADEHHLFEKLMDAPFTKVSEAEITAIKDHDTQANYSFILGFRDHLVASQTIEQAYSSVFLQGGIKMPPVFLDQMAHLILRNILGDVKDPLLLRMAELFFREQIVSIEDEKIMLADSEIVEMRTAQGGPAGQFVMNDPQVSASEVSLDIMDEKNKQAYWERSDNFDMAVDFRFTQPAQDALGRVIEAWIKHFKGIETRVQAVKSIQDEAWAWHIGCDSQATEILNSLYNGDEVSEERLGNILALYKLDFVDSQVMQENVRGKSVYLGLAKNDKMRIIFKPQNLLVNLPISTG